MFKQKPTKQAHQGSKKEVEQKRKEDEKRKKGPTDAADEKKAEEDRKKKAEEDRKKANTMKTLTATASIPPEATVEKCKRNRGQIDGFFLIMMV